VELEGERSNLPDRQAGFLEEDLQKLIELQDVD